MIARLGGAAPSLVVVGFTCTHPVESVLTEVHAKCPGALMLGCTTCRGVLANDQWVSNPNKECAFSLWAMSDPDGTFEVIHLLSCSSLTMSVEDWVQLHVARAIAARGGEAPRFAFVLGSPGGEEAMLRGLAACTEMAQTPILGGSAADNSLAGDWWQISQRGSSDDGSDVREATYSSDGVCIALGWSSCTVAASLGQAFDTTEHRGTVTKVSDVGGAAGRSIVEIDGKSALDVYNGWTSGELLRGLEQSSDGVATIIARTSLMPLGVTADDGFEYTRVLHPAFADSSVGAIFSFASVETGDQVQLLRTTKDSLANGVASAARTLLNNSREFSADECIGALMIFCGGLVMTIDEQMPLAAEQLSSTIAHRNSLGLCTFGEDGRGASGAPTHGNLMCGCLLFSSRPVGSAAGASGRLSEGSESSRRYSSPSAARRVADPPAEVLRLLEGSRRARGGVSPKKAPSSLGDKPIRVLSLDGGGVKGLNLLLMLRALEKAGGRPIGAMFDLICGTSVGGAIALGCACMAEDACSRLEELLHAGVRDCFKNGTVSHMVRTGHKVPVKNQLQFVRDQLVSAMGLPDVESPTPHAGSKLETAGAGESGATAPYAFAVATHLTDGESPQPFLCRNYELPDRSSRGSAGSSGWPMWEAVCATTAAPTYFAAHKRENGTYVDGALVANNPTLLAIEQAHLLWPDREIGLLLSLGGGQSQYAPSSSVVAWMSTTFTLAFDPDRVNQTVRDMQSSLNVRGYVRLAPNTGAVKLDESRPQVLSSMMEECQRYLEERTALLEALGPCLAAESVGKFNEAEDALMAVAAAGAGA